MRAKLLRFSKKFTILFALAILLYTWLCVGFSAKCFAGQRSSGLVGIFISKEIAPFIEMVEGLESSLGMASCRIFFDSHGLPYSADPRFHGIKDTAFAAVVAVGPMALEYLVKAQWHVPVVYAMVLSPEKIISGFQTKLEPCGVSLQLPYGEYFLRIRSIIPKLRRLGVLFDPENNAAWFEGGRRIAGVFGIHLVPLMVKTKADISALFKKPRLNIDAMMFIPDRTVISESIIRFAIKQGIYAGIPSIGYNKFFFISGAAVSFVIDYKGVGVRTAAQVRGLLKGLPCQRYVPPYTIYINTRVFDRLGIELGKSLPRNVIKR